VEKDVIQKYVNNFRRNIASFLKPNIGLQIDIYNCGIEGAVLVITFKPGGKSLDNERNEFSTISDVISQLDQHFFGGNLKGLHFKGTNLMMDPKYILLIKDNSPSEWTDQKMSEDIRSIIKPPSIPKQS
jgi:hypothetical protein